MAIAMLHHTVSITADTSNWDAGMSEFIDTIGRVHRIIATAHNATAEFVISDNMESKQHDQCTEAERNELYDLLDNLASQYFGRDGDDSEWETSILRVAEIIGTKRKRVEEVAARL